MAAGKGHPAKEKAAKQKTIKEKQKTIHEKKSSPDKQKTVAGDDKSPKKQPTKQKTVIGDENSPKKQPTKKKTIREEKKVKLFEDKQEKAWAADGSPEAGKIELATVAEEDPNVFQGEPMQGEASPMTPRAKEEERRKAAEIQKIANGLQAQQSMNRAGGKEGEQTKTSLMNIDKFLLES